MDKEIIDWIIDETFEKIKEELILKEDFIAYPGEAYIVIVSENKKDSNVVWWAERLQGFLRVWQDDEYYFWVPCYIKGHALFRVEESEKYGVVYNRRPTEEEAKKIFYDFDDLSGNVLDACFGSFKINKDTNKNG